MEVVCPHFPCASLTQSTARSLKGDLWLTSHESRIAHVKDIQDLTSVGKISKEKRVQLTFTGKSWEEGPFRLKPGICFLTKWCPGRFLSSSSILHSCGLGLFLRRAFPAPEWLCAGHQMKTRGTWEKEGCQLTTSTGWTLWKRWWWEEPGTLCRANPWLWRTAPKLMGQQRIWQPTSTQRVPGQ